MVLCILLLVLLFVMNFIARFVVLVIAQVRPWPSSTTSRCLPYYTTTAPPLGFPGFTTPALPRVVAEGWSVEENRSFLAIGPTIVIMAEKSAHSAGQAAGIVPGRRGGLQPGRVGGWIFSLAECAGLRADGWVTDAGGALGYAVAKVGLSSPRPASSCSRRSATTSGHGPEHYDPACLQPVAPVERPAAVVRDGRNEDPAVTQSVDDRVGESGHSALPYVATNDR